jgi:hypothetical protein
MTLPNLSSLWRSIEQSGAVDLAAIRFIDASVTLPSGSALVGIDGQNQRHLCIPAIPSELGQTDKVSRGVTVEVRELMNPSGQLAPFVDVHCRNPELNRLFEIVAQEILADCLTSDSSMFVTAHRCLDRWRELLESGDQSPLTQKDLAALCAELLLLERLANGGVPPVGLWLGPDDAPHDFVCGPVDFEVKSTLMTHRREVSVNGLTQLEETPGSKLYLWWIRLRPSPGRGISVPELVARLIERGAEQHAFLKKLRKRNYDRADSDRYSALRFEVIDSALYQVNDEFPRLTTKSLTHVLPTSVTRVDYVINLDSDNPKPMGAADAEALFNSVKVFA